MRAAVASREASGRVRRMVVMHRSIDQERATAGRLIAAREAANTRPALPCTWQPTHDPGTSGCECESAFCGQEAPTSGS